MHPISFLRQSAESAADAIAYAVFNLVGTKVTDLRPGLIDSTDPAESALIAERDLRAALQACSGLESTSSSNGWRPLSSAPRDGTVVDLWSPAKGGRRALNVRFLKADEVDARYAKGGVWAHLARDGWRLHAKDDSVLVEAEYTHWRPAAEDRPDA